MDEPVRDRFLSEEAAREFCLKRPLAQLCRVASVGQTSRITTNILLQLLRWGAEAGRTMEGSD